MTFTPKSALNILRRTFSEVLVLLRFPQRESLFLTLALPLKGVFI